MAKIVFNSEEIEDIISEYNSGKTMREIAEKYHVSTTPILKVINQNRNFINERKYKSQKWTIDTTYFDNIDTQEKAYILGFLYSDGANTSNYENGHYCISLTLKASDDCILEKINYQIGSNRPLVYYSVVRNDVQYTYCRLDICNKHIVKRLNDIGVIQRKTTEIKFPHWLNESLYPHFIRGYFDGDGSINFSCNAWQLNTIGTLDFCTRLSEIITHYSNATTHVYSAGKDKSEFIKQFVVCGRLNISKFLQYIYKDATLYLERKYDIAQNCINNIKQTV